MGTRVAPSYAYIFMHMFETFHLPNAPIQLILWKRYIDDILALFVCTDQQLQEFNTWLNPLQTTIKFIMEYKEEGIPFLETVLKTEKSKIRIRPYSKPTDTKQYIQPNSCNPPDILRSILFFASSSH